jgi:DHA1 family multidrug resistance protein-like MFS transporter
MGAVERSRDLRIEAGGGGAATRQLARLCATAVVAYCSYAMCRAPLLPLFARELGAGPSLIGLVVSASTVTGILLKLPAGAVSDVLGRRPLLLAGALIFALMPMAYLTVGSIAALMLVRFVHGSATALFGPVATASVADLAPPERRGAWLGTYATSQGCGQAVAPVLAGYLIATGGFDRAFLVAAAIGVMTPLLARGVGSGRPGPAAAAPWPAFVAGIREVAGDRLVLVTSAAHAGQFVMHGALTAFLPLYARDVIGLSLTQIGWLFAAQTATTLAVRPVLGATSDRVDRRLVVVAGLVTSAVTVWLLPLARTPASLAAVVLVYAAGVATTTAATSAFITDISRRSRYGAAHGVFGTIYDIGDAAGPRAAGLSVATSGYALMFTCVSTVGLLMAAVFAVTARGRAVSRA